MSSHLDTAWPADPLRAGIPRPCQCAYEHDDLLGRLEAILDFGAPLAYGLATWAAACRLTFLLRWVKPFDNAEADGDWPC